MNTQNTQLEQVTRFIYFQCDSSNLEFSGALFSFFFSDLNGSDHFWKISQIGLNKEWSRSCVYEATVASIERGTGDAI